MNRCLNARCGGTYELFTYHIPIAAKGGGFVEVQQDGLLCPVCQSRATNPTLAEINMTRIASHPDVDMDIIRRKAGPNLMGKL